MAGKVDNLVPWIPDWLTSGMESERVKFIRTVQADQPHFTLRAILRSADYHVEVAKKVTDAAIYRMIMKESEQE